MDEEATPQEKEELEQTREELTAENNTEMDRQYSQYYTCIVCMFHVLLNSCMFVLAVSSGSQIVIVTVCGDT